MRKFDDILKESKNIPDFKSFDVDKEWNNFVKVLETEALIGSNALPNKSRSYQKFLIPALALLVVSAAAFYFLSQKPKPVYQIIETKENLDTVIFADGSKLYLGKNSKAEFPIAFAKDGRFVKLQGQGTFDVNHDAANPFKVYYGELQIRVLGTQFSLLKTKDLTVIENHSGTVEVSQILNKNNSITLHDNDVYLYQTGKFKTPKDTIQVVASEPEIIVEEKPKAPPVKEEVIKVEEPVKETVHLSTYFLEDVINDHLLKYFKKSVKVEKKSKLNLKAKIKLDINAPLKTILIDLKAQGYIDYKDGKCDGCYIIVPPGE